MCSKPTRPVTRSSGTAPGRSCTAERVSSTSKNWARAGACMNRLLVKPTTWPSRPMRWVAKPMKVTISPTLASPLRLSQAPRAKMVMMVMVEAAPLSTLTAAHQLSTGNWALSTWSITWRSCLSSAI